jgi:heme O synthase-like polyprenyltransferase
MAEGRMLDLRLWSIMVIIALWQLPHIGLLVLSHRADYSKEKIPSFLSHVRTVTLRRIIFFWVLNLAVMMLFLAVQGVVITEPAKGLMVLNAIVLVAVFAGTYRTDPESSSPRLFIHLNAAIFVMMILPVVERVILFYSQIPIP